MTLTASPPALGDKVLLEILRSRFQAIVEEMSWSIMRTAHTVFVKETLDFGAFLVSPTGDVFAVPIALGVVVFVGFPAGRGIAAIDSYQPGDVVICNDPNVSKGMVTHLPDIFLWKPIFHEGRVVCFAMDMIHATDVGGRLPGSIGPSNHDIWQEGLIIPPTKLIKAGVLDNDILQVILTNCRIPDSNWGDLKALLAGLETAERGIARLIERYGVETVAAGIPGVMDHAETEARSMIRAIPDGTYSFSDYLEGDHIGLRNVRFKVTISVEGDEMTLDWTGTDLQVRGAFNLPTNELTGHYTLIPAVLNYFRTRNPTIPVNNGLARPIKVVAPKGSLLNPQPSAAIGARGVTMNRVMDAVQGALSQALPEWIPSAGSGQTGNLTAATRDLHTGQLKVSVIQPLRGGSGARPHLDGVNGQTFFGGWLRNIPVESIESEMALLALRYRLRPDSGGPGRRRGGMGIEYGFKNFAPSLKMTARNMDRYIFQPWGLLGGRPGARGRTVLVRANGLEEYVGKLDVLTLQPGDAIYFWSQGGGGFGSPLEREPELVLDDVLQDLVSVAQAHDVYGVCLTGAVVDMPATAQLRAQLRSEQTPGLVDLGPDREAYDVLWPDAMLDELDQISRGYPAGLQTFVRDKLISAIDRERGHGVPDLRALESELGVARAAVRHA